MEEQRVLWRDFNDKSFLRWINRFLYPFGRKLVVIFDENGVATDSYTVQKARTMKLSKEDVKKAIMDLAEEMVKELHSTK